MFTVLDDEHRMQLKPLPDHRDCLGDYVNASYVDVSLTNLWRKKLEHLIIILYSLLLHFLQGYHTSNKYLATQGSPPITHTASQQHIHKHKHIHVHTHTHKKQTHSQSHSALYE